MDGWNDGCLMDGWLNEWMVGCINGCMDGWLMIESVRWLDGWMIGGLDKWSV